MNVVLDSSAVLALLWKEPGADRVAKTLGSAAISTVNVSEVVAKLVDRGFEPLVAKEALLTIGLDIVVFDTETSILAGQLRQKTKNIGLSLGDRACIALGMRTQNKILTADRIWSEVGEIADIEVIREVIR